MPEQSVFYRTLRKRGEVSYLFFLFNFSSNSQAPGARFSKVPVIYGPVNLSGPLSGNFIGPEVAFLEAPVDFPGTYRARKNSGPLPDSREGTYSNHSLCATGLFSCVSIRRTMQYVISLTLRSSLFQRRATKRPFLCIII